MTNREALLAVVAGIEVSDPTAEKALLDGGLIGGDIYTPDNRKAVDLCAIDLLYTLYTAPDMREGDYGISHPDFLRKVEVRLLYLARLHGVQQIINQFERKAAIANGTNKW